MAHSFRKSELASPLLKLFLVRIIIPGFVIEPAGVGSLEKDDVHEDRFIAKILIILLIRPSLISDSKGWK